LDVLTHCLIVGEVAKNLIKRLPSHIQELFFPPGVEIIVAAHDVGKVSPDFQEKIHQGVTNYLPNSLEALKYAEPTRSLSDLRPQNLHFQELPVEFRNGAKI